MSADREALTGCAYPPSVNGAEPQSGGALTGGGYQPVARSAEPNSGDGERRVGRQPRTVAPRVVPKPAQPVKPPPGGGGVRRPSGK